MHARKSVGRTGLIDLMPWQRWRLVSAFRQLQLHMFSESVTSNQICPWPVCLRQEVWVVGWHSLLLRCQSTSSWVFLLIVHRQCDHTAEYVDSCWDPYECSGRNTLDASDVTPPQCPCRCQILNDVGIYIYCVHGLFSCSPESSPGLTSQTLVAIFCSLLLTSML